MKKYKSFKLNINPTRNIHGRQLVIFPIYRCFLSKIGLAVQKP